MRIALFVFVFSLMFGLDVQCQTFKTFYEVEKNKFFLWIFPEDFDETFVLLKQDLLDKKLVNEKECRDTLDEYRRYLSQSWLEEKGEKADSLGRAQWRAKWAEMVPPALKERLQDYARTCVEERSKGIGPYTSFSVEAVIDRQGVVRTVYFRALDSVAGALLKEEELQSIRAAIMAERVDANLWDFSRYSEAAFDEWYEKFKEVKEFRDSIIRNNIQPDDIFQEKHGVADYGIISCFHMDFEIPRLDGDEAIRFIDKFCFDERGNDD